MSQVGVAPVHALKSKGVGFIQHQWKPNRFRRECDSCGFARYDDLIKLGFSFNNDLDSIGRYFLVWNRQRSPARFI
jgi:hypothetical protein